MDIINWNLPKRFKPKKEELLKQTKTVHTEDGTYHRNIFYYDCICTFDIETTTINDPERPYAFMYIYQFCFDNDEVYMGRTFDDFRKLIQKLKRDLKLRYNQRLIIYVHNLSYEWQFIKDFMEIYEVFEMGPHKILSFVAEGIEFRCSYLLTNMSLAKLCKNTPTCVHNKLSGDDYNYNERRTPRTILTPEELQYCFNDVKGLAECLEYRLQDETLITIPKTSTGYVRREMRNNMKKDEHNHRMFVETALTPYLYKLNRLCFRGGDTHSNPSFTGMTITEPVHVKDIKSSYPASLVMNTYPIGNFVETDPVEYMEHFEENQKQFCSIIVVTYEDLEYVAPDNMPYLPANKCTELVNCIYDNGRVRYCKYAQMALVDIDYRIAESSYTYKHKIITKVYKAFRGHLPLEFRETVMEFFRTKSKLDGNPDMKYEYAKAKAKLNSTYGLCVYAPDKSLSEWIEGEIVPQEKSLEEMLTDYYDSRNNFLPYQWGVWCTAWSRMRLRVALQMVGKDAVYCDTDSVFYVGDHEKDFEELNNKLREAAFMRKAYAEDNKGELLYLGIFEDDKEFTGGFKTLGAKKYIGVLNNGEWYCTIAGVSKSKGAEFFKEHGFEAFCDMTTITDSGHLVAYYNEDKKHYIKVDGCWILTASNIALIDQDYTIGVDDDYLHLISMQQNGIQHIY